MEEERWANIWWDSMATIKQLNDFWINRMLVMEGALSNCESSALLTIYIEIALF